MISVLFYGTPEIARICLEALLRTEGIAVRGVVTQPDRPTGRKQILTPSPVKLLAQQHQIPVLQPERIKKDPQGFAREVSALGPIDIAVVVAFGQILPESTLALPRCGSLNLHASLLPRWRGAAPIQRSLMSGDQETGVCLMQMDVGLDTGAVFASHHIAISKTDTAQTLHDRIATDGANLIVKLLPAIVAGTITAAPQEEEGITYAAKITDEDGMIDWQQPASLVSCQIRGLSPRPGAYTLMNGRRLKLFDCSADDSPSASAPGTVSACGSDTFSIACNPGTLSVRAVQLEGKTRMSVLDFLKGNELPAGTQFTRV